MRRSFVPVLFAALAALTSCRHVTAPQPTLSPIAPQSLPRTTVTVPVRMFVESAESASVVSLPQSGVRIAVVDHPIVTETDLIDVELTNAELGRCLMFHLTPEAARRINDVIADGRARRLVVAINDVTLGARRLDQPITNGLLPMFVEVPDAYLPRLLATMKSNAGRRSPNSLERN